MTSIKELIHIRDHVDSGDFVLRLSEGITDPEGNVKHYQVTPQLVKCFDDALNLVRSTAAIGELELPEAVREQFASFAEGERWWREQGN